MSRHKAAKNCLVLPWLSRRLDNAEGRFIQVGNSLLLSSKDEAGRERNPYINLTAGAKLLYLCMCMESGGKRDFEFPRASALKYGLPVSSFRRNLEELIEAGFIKRDSGWTVREPNRYTFSNDWKSPK